MDALADRYEIRAELGQGGMAVVYLAHDHKHDRPVALKVVRPELRLSLGPARFLREIQIAARLTHPNILPLYDSGEVGGTLFYAMPFLEGESLRDLLNREGQLPVADAIRIARQVADALAYAHSMGVVHRDIKPENILFEAGHAIVADFGVARAVSESGADQLTQTGMSVGTPAYMSPEQIAGQANIDGRSDIYSLGCVLYEMVVGQVPFTGPTAQAIMARHSMDAVPPPHIVRESIPEELEDIVLQALAKTPADRFRSATDFIEALDGVGSGAAPHITTATRRLRRGRPARSPILWLLAGSTIIAVLTVAVLLWPRIGQNSGTLTELDPRGVAVLYFDDLSPDGNLTPVADGLTEDLIDQLSHARGIHVISRNGVAPYRGLLTPPDSIARALDVGVLIAGSVERTGNALRLGIRLIDGESGVDFRRESWEIPATEVLGAQDSVAIEVSQLLRERLGDEVRLRERRAETQNVDAWLAVQRAERLRKEAEESLEGENAESGFADLRRADSLLVGAELLDPRWAQPIIQRGWIAYRQARLAGDLPTALDRITLGLGHADRALAMASTDPHALELRGTLRYFHWILGVIPNPDEQAALLHAAQSDLEAAVNTDPSLASAHSTLSHLYYQTENAVSALVAARRAYEEDAYLAVAPEVLWRLFLGNYDLEQLTQARRWCDEGARRFPEDFRFAECRLWSMTMPGVEPNVARAWRLWNRLVELVPAPVRAFQSQRARMIVGGILARAGLADSARAVLVHARASADVDPNLELQFIEAYMRTLTGDDDEAIALLRRFFTANPVEQESDAGWDAHWWWRELRTHPAFTQVTGRN
ncbi:MAG: serine/threonine-protein kinase [Gemmatimonadota bacterium]|nr:serine/threonine-protein kinase [Gemmatimonadota bacterium]MDH3366825.1 serine/threonine-protein kinase [Gemmatimonadota bacterium]MDH3479641.1 serine/threonine-protein kinase [Gemmatimonadota bacterium]MDH3570236.1 serine/threonine-protein kinase [Gemmatimonadota bacterium]MDH5548916.1 serine/threonine-protein kinase [Gemmatimonadota bacterium]